jgi:hypothetical protein
VGLAALYALIDGWRNLVAGMRTRVRPPLVEGGAEATPDRRRVDGPTVDAERDPE